MTIASRRDQVRAAVQAAGFNPSTFKWNEAQMRENTSADNPMGDEPWDGVMVSLDWALRNLRPGEVVHVLVAERGEFGQLEDIVTVVLQ